MLRQAYAHIAQIVSGDLSYFGGPIVEEDVAGRIRAEQVSVIFYYLPLMMLANACNALIFLAAGWMSPDRFFALAWATLVVAFTLHYGIRLRTKRDVKPPTVSARTVRRAVRNAFMLGTLWAALPFFFFVGAPSGMQLIITCLCAGMLAGGVFAFASLPVAAIAFTTPIVVASASVIARNGDQAYFFVALLMFVYTFVLIGGAFAQGLRTASRVVAQVAIENELRRDMLTGLPNRTLFEESLCSAFARLDRAGERFALLYLDLDDFKSINDKFGHAAGDGLLANAAQRLRACTREADFIARIGGDEFALIATNTDTPQAALALAERILDTLRVPFEIDGVQVSMALSVGIAFAPADGADPEALAKSAEVALYSAKRTVGRSVQMFDAQCDAKARERRALALDLREALERDELHLVFQPLHSISDERIVGCEALLRWMHPKRGLVPPLDFIRIAEETELIHPIGEWVLREACRTASEWPEDTKVAVNFSAVQFRRTSTLAMVVKALADTGMAPSRLEVEITESILISEDDTALATLNALRHLGVQIALDDFGTGYSSLSYLRKLPLDRIKIDASFVRDLLLNPDCASIVKSVINLGKDLGISVTAEGVETKEQLAWLREMHCSEVQGYLFSAPQPAASITGLFAIEALSGVRAQLAG